MSEEITLLCRPPVGFVVEGHGEYNCYPSLVCRIIDGAGLNVPRVNAGGCGNIVRHLGEQLKALVLAHHPYHIIIGLDLKDLLERGLYGDCRQLRADLESQAREWLVSSQSEPRFHPLPERIIVVVQIQTFESWIISDLGGLRESGYLAVDLPQFSNTDQEVPDPVAWLRKYMAPGRNQKNPKCAKAIISCLDPATMRANSPSFDKFCREILLSYSSWYQACHIL
jgi:hypothetical protein